jgi:hypothetical protein
LQSLEQVPVERKAQYHIFVLETGSALRHLRFSSWTGLAATMVARASAMIVVTFIFGYGLKLWLLKSDCLRLVLRGLTMLEMGERKSHRTWEYRSLYALSANARLSFEAATAYPGHLPVRSRPVIAGWYSHGSPWDG